MLPKQVELLTSLDFKGAQVVFVGVVAIELVLTERSIAVALPATAEIDLVVDASYAIAAANHQPQGIVLSIAGIGDLQLAKDWREEGTRRAQAVDAQGIVASILERPFAMVDEAWRQGVQMEVAHSVGTDDHRRTLCIEGVHHALQGLGRAVEVIAVKLHHKAPHHRMVYCRVPAAANAQVVALRDDVDETFVASKLIDSFCRTVCTSIIYHNKIEGERCLLLQHATDGIANGALAIADGNHHRSLHGKLALAEIHLVILIPMQVGIQGSQMTGAGALHFHLTGTIARVNIVELLLTAQACVVFHLGI